MRFILLQYFKTDYNYGIKIIYNVKKLIFAALLKT